MYDSRSSHPRGGLHWGRENRKWDGDRIPVRPNIDEQVAIREGVLAYLDEHESAREVKAQQAREALLLRRDIERAHGEALIEHYSRLEEEAWAWLAEQPEDEDVWERDARYFEGVDTPNMNTFDDCWMPLVTVEQAREHFGRDFLGNGFHIDSHNVERRR